MESHTSPVHSPHVLREYAMLADGERAALIGPHGDIAWMCMPGWADGAVFSALIGGGGSFAVTPSDCRHVWGGSYEDGTLIWTSRWVSTEGIIESREALALPADAHRAVLLRRVRAVSGSGRINLSLELRARFGVCQMTHIHRERGIWTAQSGPIQMRLTGADTATVDGPLLRLTQGVGDCHDFILELSDEPLDSAPVNPDAAWATTENAWRRGTPRFSGSIAPDDSRQSYAVLRGLTSSTGAMVAAATMGMPERVDAKRNYDYRYAWIRDQCYAGEAVAAGGAWPLLDDAVRFVSARLLADGPNLKPAYTVTGGAVPDEAELDLPGYPGGSNTTGNRANNQFQLDTFGETLLLFSAAAEADRLDLENWRAVESAVAAITRRWQEPDAGIWELDDQHWAHSRLICAAGLRAISRHAPTGQESQWKSLADFLVTDTTKGCVHRSGRWQRNPADPRVDAALLLPAIRSAVAADDPRSVATVAAIQAELSHDGYVYRFSRGPGPLSESEGAFLLCGFNMALAVHQQGRETEAMQWFERNRAACGSPGLFTEEYDVAQRQLRGNLPQTFVHAAMLETAHRLGLPARSSHVRG